MTNIEKLHEKLKEMGVNLGGITLGDNPGTPEDVAGALYNTLVDLQKALETGEFEINGFEEVTNLNDLN